MADNLTTPIPGGAVMATKDIGGVQHPKNILVDQTGADAIGEVTATPGANTLLGRLRAIVTALTDRLPLLGARAAAGSMSVTPSTDGFPVTGTFFQATQPVSATALPLPAGAATETSTAAIGAKLPSLGPKAASGSVSVAPASDATFTTADVGSAPARRTIAITPHDTNALAEVPRALYVGVAGDITMRGVDGAVDQVWKAVPAGSLLPFRPQYIRAAGTTAASILGLI